MKANVNDLEMDSLTELGMRPVAQVFNQIRYWSALDDPTEEKWDYLSHYTRTERREKGIGGAPVSGSMNTRPIIAAALIVLLLIGLGTGGYLAWPYLSSKLPAFASGTPDLTVVNGYMVRLGARDLGVVEDKDALDAFIANWLTEQNSGAGTGVTYTLAQPVTYDELRIDAPYCASLEDMQNAFIKHAALDVARP